MFAGLTHEDIAKLSDEQREAIARIVLDQARNKRNLEKKAKGYLGYYLVPFAFLAVVASLGAFRLGEYLPLVIIGLIGLIQFHAVGINKRIDATLKLTNLLLEEKHGAHEASAETLHGKQP